MNSKKGLSDIVTTFIIIMLTLVALGIIWVVIRNLIDPNAENASEERICKSLTGKEYYGEDENGAVLIYYPDVEKNIKKLKLYTNASYIIYEGGSLNYYQILDNPEEGIINCGGKYNVCANIDDITVCREYSIVTEVDRSVWKEWSKIHEPYYEGLD